MWDLTDKDWHEVHNDDDGAAAGVLNLGSIPITRTVVRKHADIWLLYGKVLDLFAGYGSAYAFQTKVIVKYPMDLGANLNWSSYANPLNGLRQGEPSRPPSAPRSGSPTASRTC
jgi:hypothetical protein